MDRSSPCGANEPLGVRMPERATGSDAVADELLDLLDFRKAATLLARPDDLVINAHLKDATGIAKCREVPVAAIAAIRRTVRFLRRHEHGRGQAPSFGGVAETFDARNRGARVQAMDI